MNIGVVCALESEIRMFRLLYKDSGEYRSGGARVTRFDIFSHTLFLTICGVGKTCAAMAVQTLISAFDCELIINTGLSGGCDSSLSPGEAVVIEKSLYHDFPYTDLPGFSIGFPDGFRSDTDLINLASRSLDFLKIPNITGIAATGDIFVSDSSLKLRITAQTQCSCVDMEAAAIAHVASANNLPFIIVKFISDNADINAASDFTVNLKLYAEQCASFIREMVKRI